MRPASSRGAVLLAIVVCAVMASVARGSGGRFEFRLFDPTGQIRTVVTAPDLVRSSARAERRSDGSGILYFRLTKHGVAKFRTLTRALARRGARLQRRQGFDFEVNGTNYGRPLVDYTAYPDGLDAASGIGLTMQLSVARMLANAIRPG